VTSTEAQPFLRADWRISSISTSATLSASCPGPETRTSTVPTKPPTRMDGRRARTAPPTIWRPASAIKTLASGIYTSRRSRPIESSVAPAPVKAPDCAQSAYSRSTSVMRACLARYSTRTNEPQDERAIAPPRQPVLADGRLLRCRRSRGGERQYRSTATPGRLVAALLRSAHRHLLYAIAADARPGEYARAARETPATGDAGPRRPRRLPEPGRRCRWRRSRSRAHAAAGSGFFRAGRG
jgi:hypothetical protein